MDTEGKKSAPPAGDEQPPAGDEHFDVRIAGLAERQHAVISRRQLAALGVGDKPILHRIRTRRLRRVHAGVYAVGAGPVGLHGRYMAAVLACAPGAVVSHRSAAALLDLAPVPSGPIDVMIRRGGSRRRDGVAVHTTRSLLPAEVMSSDGVPCTAAARTLLDLAAVVGERALDRALERTQSLGIFDRNELDAVLVSTRGRRGAGRLRRRLADLADDPPLVRSELERRFLALIERANLPLPVVNGRVAGLEVDFNWLAHRLIAETDGRATHATAQAFERDRQRDLDLQLAGWRVIRVTWRQLADRPESVISLLRARLALG